MRIESNRSWHHLRGDHDEDCYFDHDHEASYSGTDEGLVQLYEHWNRRFKNRLI